MAPPALIQPCQKINDVVSCLSEIISWAEEHESRLGYFAALYCRVTRVVGQEIQAGYFEDGPRMEKMVILFAQRYFDAFQAWQKQTALSECWRRTFQAAGRWRLIVLQHLLLGMNAHINMDLAIAASEVAPGQPISALKNDFYKINEILFRLTADVEKRLSAIWPFLKWINRVTQKTDDALIHFSMSRARDEAWSAAVELATCTENDRSARIKKLDECAVGLSALILNPGVLLTSANLAVCLTEKRPISKALEILAS